MNMILSESEKKDFLVWAKDFQNSFEKLSLIDKNSPFTCQGSVYDVKAYIDFVTDFSKMPGHPRKPFEPIRSDAWKLQPIPFSIYGFGTD